MSDTENHSFVIGLLWSKMFLTWSAPDLSVLQAPVFLFLKTISEMKIGWCFPPRWNKEALDQLQSRSHRSQSQSWTRTRIDSELSSKIYCVLRTISEPKIENLVAIDDWLQNRWSKSWNELQESTSQRIVRTTSSDFFHQFIYFSESKVCL